LKGALFLWNPRGRGSKGLVTGAWQIFWWVGVGGCFVWFFGFTPIGHRGTKGGAAQPTGSLGGQSCMGGGNIQKMSLDKNWPRGDDRKKKKTDPHRKRNYSGLSVNPENKQVTYLFYWGPG